MWIHGGAGQYSFDVRASTAKLGDDIAPLIDADHHSHRGGRAGAYGFLARRTARHSERQREGGSHGAVEAGAQDTHIENDNHFHHYGVKAYLHARLDRASR